MLQTIVMQDDYIPTSVVDGSEADGRKGNSKKQMVWDKLEISLIEHRKYKLISNSLVFPLSHGCAATAPPRAVEPFG